MLSRLRKLEEELRWMKSLREEDSRRLADVHSQLCALLDYFDLKVKYIQPGVKIERKEP